MGTKQIQTSRFGTIEVDEALVLKFEQPILGFDEHKEFVILDHAENSPFKWLQSASMPDLAFVITNPKLFGIDYEFTVPDDVCQKLNIEKSEEILVVTIVSIPAEDPQKMTANLLGPIIINEKTRQAMQVVLNDTDFSTKTRLINDELTSPRQHSTAGQQAGE